MAWEGKIIEIFLSSPGDVQPERELVRSIVQEWNQRRSREAGCLFSLLTWEDSVTSELEDYGQGSINTQIGDNYDVILGLMWSRFGTPTGKEPSGTMEEFKRALDRKRGGDTVRISFYFKTADVPYEKMDPDQIRMVREFRELFQKGGGLSRDFTDSEQLRSQVGLLLDQVAKAKDQYLVEAPSPPDPTLPAEAVVNSSPPPPTDPKSTGVQDSADFEGLGFLDVLEQLESASMEFAVEIGQWTTRTEAMGQAAITTTEELEALARFGNPPVSEVRKFLDGVTEELEASASYAETHSDKVTSLMRRIVDLIDARIRLLDDFDVSEEDRSKALEELIDLSAAMHGSLGNNRNLMDTISRLPRMTSRFNAAQKRVVASHEPLLRELQRSSTAIGKAIGDLKRGGASIADPVGETQPTASGANTPHKQRPKRKKPQTPRKRRRR